MRGGSQICRACQTALPWGDFYNHSGMTSGHDKICKECVKTRVRENRAGKRDYYLAYDRKRYRDSPERKEAAQRCAARAFRHGYQRGNNLHKRAANSVVARALKDGRLAREPCFFCGNCEKVHAHHEDYDLPLDVVWLCPPCHGKLHTIKGDFRRAS